MKKIFIAAGVFVLVSLPAFCQPKKIQDIIGRWNVIGEQDPGVHLEIIDSADIVLTCMGEEKKMLNYKIDFSKSPAPSPRPRVSPCETLRFRPGPHQPT